MVHRTQPRSGSPLSELEASTLNAVDRAFAPARRAADRRVLGARAVTRRNAEVVNRLREANAPVVDAIVNGARQAINMGVDDAVEEAPPPDTPEGEAQAQAAHFNPHADDSTIDRLTADLRAATSDDVRRVTRTAAARATADALGLTNVVDQVNRVASNLVVTKLIGAYNRGRRWYAGLFRYELQWVTVEDNRVCPVCRPLDGQTIASQRSFRREGVTWSDVPGQPPAHPRCRCYTRVVRP